MSTAKDLFGATPKIGGILHDEGKLVGYKKWVTFTDVTGLKADQGAT